MNLVCQSLNNYFHSKAHTCIVAVAYSTRSLNFYSAEVSYGITQCSLPANNLCPLKLKLHSLAAERHRPLAASEKCKTSTHVSLSPSEVDSFCPGEQPASSAACGMWSSFAVLLCGVAVGMNSTVITLPVSFTN